MTRGVNGGGGSNQLVPAVTYATQTRVRGANGQWLTGLLPWWGWLGLAVAFIVMFGVGILDAFFQTLNSQGGHLIGEGAVALVVLGLVVAIVGFILRMVPHTEAFSKGHHMVRNGLIGAAFGLAIMFGGLNVVWGLSAVVIGDVMTGVRAKVNLPDAPPALQVQFPSLASAHSPAPAPTPTAHP